MNDIKDGILDMMEQIKERIEEFLYDHPLPYLPAPPPLSLSLYPMTRTFMLLFHVLPLPPSIPPLYFATPNADDPYLLHNAHTTCL